MNGLFRLAGQSFLLGDVRWPAAVGWLGLSLIAVQTQASPAYARAVPSLELRILGVTDSADPFSPLNVDGRFDENVARVVFAAGPLSPDGGRPIGGGSALDRLNSYRTNRHVSVRMDYVISSADGDIVAAFHVEPEYTAPLDIVSLPMPDGGLKPFARLAVEVPWYGRDNDGTAVEDGTYHYAVGGDLFTFTGEMQGSGPIGVVTLPGNLILAVSQTVVGEITVDNTPPSLVIVNPSDGSVQTTNRPEFLVTYADALSGVATASLQASLDSASISERFTVAPTSAVYDPAADEALAPGAHDFATTIDDNAGNRAESVASFEVSGTATSVPEVALAIYKRASTCIVGDPCTGTCAEIQHPDGTTFARFEANNNFRGLRPSDPAVPQYPNRVCLDLALNDADVESIRNAARGFEVQVGNASGQAMTPRTSIQVVDAAELALSRVGTGLWAGPWDTATRVLPTTSGATDAVFVVVGALDPTRNLRIPLPFCGGTFGADWGLGGSGYTYVPFSAGYWFQCSDAQVLLHEWLHQVDWAYENIMLTPDIYAAGYPACGLQDPDTLRWFPSTDTCTSDPDWTDCGAPYCASLDAWNAHVLSAHYDFSRPYVGNHCRDGRMNFGETGVDSGGHCTHGLREDVGSPRTPRWTSSALDGRIGSASGERRSLSR